jgi:hypothetical protein
MAISGDATQSFEMSVKEGKVVCERYAHRSNKVVLQDVTDGVEQLLAGKRIYMHAYGNKIEQVTRTVELLLANKAGDA